MRKTRKQRGGGPPMTTKVGFILDIVTAWKRAGGAVSGNEYNKYLSCDRYDNKDHHVHIILTDNPNVQRYLYKRNGRHDGVGDRGFAFFPDDLTYCMERGHPYQPKNPEGWNVNRWVDFLYARLCVDNYYGSCK
jgi:hypothetical protein